jgi:hypothetical protein
VEKRAIPEAPKAKLFELVNAISNSLYYSAHEYDVCCIKIGNHWETWINAQILKETDVVATQFKVS